MKYLTILLLVFAAEMAAANLGATCARAKSGGWDKSRKTQAAILVTIMTVAAANILFASRRTE